MLYIEERNMNFPQGIILFFFTVTGIKQVQITKNEQGGKTRYGSDSSHLLHCGHSYFAEGLKFRY